MALFPFPRYYRVHNTRYCDNTAYFVPISALIHTVTAEYITVSLFRLMSDVS